MTDEEIFKKGSTTYYWSSAFFPKNIRDDVFKLYSFVRVVDDYVDQPKPDIKNFQLIVKSWNYHKTSLGKEVQFDDTLNGKILKNICYVVHRYKCEPGWIDAFLESMQMDIDNKNYNTIDDTLDYVYGSAEVIGLLMAKVMGLPKEAYHYAKMQGRAMQFINFIRDIQEDLTLGRLYFPHSDIQACGLDIGKNLSKNALSLDSVKNNKKQFALFISMQLDRYGAWQKEADKGFAYIPKRSRIAVRTAVDMYNWTAKELRKDPSLIYKHKVKPSKKRIIKTGVTRVIYG